MVETKEIYNKAKASKKQFERTAKRMQKLPLQLVKGKQIRAEAGDAELLEKVDAELKNLQELNGTISRSLNEVEVSLLKLSHSRQLKKQARRNMPLAERRAQKAAAKQVRKEKQAAAKAEKAAEKATRRQAREAKKQAKQAEKASKQAAEKAAKRARKEAKQRAKKENRLAKMKKGGAADPGAVVETAPAVSSTAPGAVGVQSSN